MSDLRLVGKRDSTPVHGYKSHGWEFSPGSQSTVPTQYFKVQPRFFAGNFGLDRHARVNCRGLRAPATSFAVPPIVPASLQADIAGRAPKIGTKASGTLHHLRFASGRLGEPRHHRASRAALTAQAELDALGVIPDQRDPTTARIAEAIGRRDAVARPD